MAWELKIVCSTVIKIAWGNGRMYSEIYERLTNCKTVLIKWKNFEYNKDKQNKKGADGQA